MTQLTHETITLAYDPTYGWLSLRVRRMPVPKRRKHKRRN